MTATIRRVARPRGVLSDETVKALARARAKTEDAETAWRQMVVWALDEGSFSAVSEATGLSTNTLQRWKREQWSLTHGDNHAPLPDGALLDPGYCEGCDSKREAGK